MKLRKSFENTNEKIQSIETDLASNQHDLSIHDASLQVKGTIYPNTTIVFGKYRRILNREYNHVTITMENNEIKIL